MSKARKPIIANANGTKITIDGYFDLQTFKMKPVSEHFIDQLCEKLVAWVDQEEDALVFEEFFQLTKIYGSDFYNWLPKHENLRRAHEYAKTALAIRREKGGLKRKLDPGMVQASMPMYSKAWKDMTEWKAKLKEESAAQGNNITVIIDKVPDSPLVKVKKLSEFSKDFEEYLRSLLTKKQVAELKEEILKEWQRFKKSRKKLKKELLDETDSDSGQMPFRKVSDNITVILGLFRAGSSSFGDQFIALDCHDARDLNDMVCHVDGKTIVMHGTLHIKLLSNGQIVGRFDPDEEER